MSKLEVREFASVWDAIADSPEEAANLKIRSELMMKIQALIAKNGCTQAATAKQCGISQPRINDLMRGRISRFSLDALVNIVTALGQQVHIELEETSCLLRSPRNAQRLLESIAALESGKGKVRNLAK